MRWILAWVAMPGMLGCADSHSPSEPAGSGDAGVVERDAGPPAVDAGPGWTVDPDHTYADLRCYDEAERPTLFIEIWGRGLGECAPPPDVDLEELVILAIESWSGAPGTYVVGEETPDGTARAGGGGPDAAPDPGWPEGTITIEPFERIPGVVSWELSIGSGRTDISRCAYFEELTCP